MVLAIDLGGTFFKYGLIDDEGKISNKGKVSTPQYTEGKTKEDFLSVIDSIMEKAKKSCPSIEGIAMSAPGIIDDTNGFMHTAGALVYLAGSCIGEELSKRYGCRVSVENDGKCAALAEFKEGALKGCVNCAVVILGTGVGGGIIIDGKLYRGRHGSAGEYSYVCENPCDAYNGKDSAFWATSSGVLGLCNFLAELTGEKANELNGEIIFSRVEKGDEKACKALKKYTDILAAHIFNLNILLDLDAVAIGGGISANNLLMEYLERSMNSFYNRPPMNLLGGNIPLPKLTVCAFRADANLLGAYYHYKFPLIQSKVL